MRRVSILFMLFLCGSIFAQEGRFLNYSAADGLSSNTVYAIVQDQDGFLWIGTRNGLNRFDGTRFKTIKEGLPSVRVTSLAIDHQNRLWIGTTEGLCLLDLGASGDDGRGLQPAGAESDGKGMLNPGAGSTGAGLQAALVQGPRGHIRALCADSQGKVWAATIDNKLLKLSVGEDGSIQTLAELWYSKDHFEGDYPYQQIYEDASGRLWLGGRIVHCQYVDNGEEPSVHFRFHGTCAMGSYAEVDGTLYAYSDFVSTIGTFEGEKINELGKLPIAHGSLLADSKGRLWVAGSYGLGLVNLQKPESTPVFRHSAEDSWSLASSELYCIFEDRQGNLWVGGDNGLSVLCPTLQLVHSVNGLPSRQITDLMQSRDGRLWVGTADNGAYALDLAGGKMEHIDYRPSGRANEGHVSCLCEDSRGTVYIGLWAGCGFNIYKNGKVSRGAISGPIPLEQHIVASEDRKTANWISDFLEDSNGRFWVVSWEGVGLNEWDRSSGKTLPPQWLSPFKYPTPEKDKPSYISSRLGSRLIEDTDGNLVYGTTEAGLNIIDSKTGLVKKYLPDPSDSLSIPDNYVTDLCLAPDGTLWAATRAGLWSPSGRSLLKGKLVQSVQTDAKGRLWAGTEEGLYCIGDEAGTAIASTGLGFPSNIYNEHAACILADGSMAFGGPAGAVIFHPDSLLSAAVPELMISDYMRDRGHLQLSFSSTNIPLSSRLQYRYRLEGEDKDWIYAEYPNLQIRYNNLRPGKYTLRIECSDLFGRWKGERFVQEFRVRWPLLLRWPFILLYVALLLGLVRLIILLRERRLRQDNARLEAAVDEKTAQIKEELDTRNHFFSIISHDLRGPVYGIRQLSEELVQKGETLPKEEMQLALEKLHDAAGGTSALLENLLMWSLNQKGVLAPVMREENLKEILDAAVDSLRENAALKRVALEIDADAEIGLQTDHNMLTTCLRNLLVNAVRFSPEGGKVLLKARQTDSDTLISVADEGPGMDETMLRTLSKPGRLGLVITKDLVEKMGGSLSARNKKEGGCEMTITLERYGEKT